jgi:hypothetical protein
MALLGDDREVAELPHGHVHAGTITRHPADDT